MNPRIWMQVRQGGLNDLAQFDSPSSEDCSPSVGHRHADPPIVLKLRLNQRKTITSHKDCFKLQSRLLS